MVRSSRLGIGIAGLVAAVVLEIVLARASSSSAAGVIGFAVISLAIVLQGVPLAGLPAALLAERPRLVRVTAIGAIALPFLPWIASLLAFGMPDWLYTLWFATLPLPLMGVCLLLIGKWRAASRAWFIASVLVLGLTLVGFLI